jgi:SAM-dependent methyltransferase
MKEGMGEPSPEELRRIYRTRFDADKEYRRCVWQVLIAHFFQRYLPPSATVLDLGCGYGEFINAVKAQVKFGMDLNPRARDHLAPEVRFLEQDCSRRWPFADGELDLVFTSNFFEHLPDKATLGRTLDEAFRCLKLGGQLIALGPNMKYTRGQYWDFWDHYLPLTESSLSEGLMTRGFVIELCRARFLPYTMVRGPRYPLWMVAVYVRLAVLWRFWGAQFLVIGRKPT